MKKLILGLMLIAAPAFGQRSISVSTNGMPLPVGSWGLQIAPTNMVWQGNHENRANVTNTSAGKWVFQGGVTHAAGVTNSAHLRMTGWVENSSNVTNTSAGQVVFQGGTLLSAGSTNTAHLRMTGWIESSSAFTNTSAGKMELAGGLRGSAGWTNTAHIRSTGWLENNVSTNTGHGQFASTVGIVGVLSLSAAISFPDNVRQTFNPGTTTPGLSVGSFAGDPSGPSNGDVWYNSSSEALRARINGATVSLGASGGGGGDDKIATNGGAGFLNSFYNSTNYGRATVRGTMAQAAIDLAGDHVTWSMDSALFARTTLTNNMIIGITAPSAATDVGQIGRIRVLDTNVTTAFSITWSNATARGPLPIAPGTNMFYVHWDGTNLWVEAGQNAVSGTGSHYALTNGPSINDITLKGISSVSNMTFAVSNRVVFGSPTSSASNIYVGQITFPLAGTTGVPGSGQVSVIQSNNILYSVKSDGTMVNLENAVGGSSSFTSTNVYVNSTANIVLDLAGYDLFRVHMLTNATIVFSNVTSLTRRAQVYFQQDTNGTRNLTAYSAVGGVVQTNATMVLTTNASAVDLLEVMPGFFTTNLFVWWPQNFQPRIGYTNSLASASCATADTTLDHDQLLEGYGAGGAENTWLSWVNVDVATYDQNFDTSALTTGKPTGACNTGVQVTINNTSGNESLYWDRGSAVTLASQAVDFYAYLYVTTEMDASENFTIISLNATATGSGSVTVWVNLRSNAGAMEVSAEGGNSSTWGALVENSWNLIKVHMDTATTGNTSYIQVNGGSTLGFNRSGTEFRYVHIGAVQNHAVNEAATYVLDLITADFP